MDVQPVLTPEAKARIERIVREAIIEGQYPVLGLHDLYALELDAALGDANFMAAYLNQVLAAQGSTFRVEPRERYFFTTVALGSICHLALVDSVDKRTPERLFTFGRYTPAIKWNPGRTGDDLETHRRDHLETIERDRLRAAAAAEVAAITARLAAYLTRRLDEAEITDVQNRHLSHILPNDKNLAAWANVCHIMGWSFTHSLATACVLAPVV